MSYEDAHNLKEGDLVIIKDTQEEYAVETINGTTAYIFVLLNNGRTYRNDQIRKNQK